MRRLAAVGVDYCRLCAQELADMLLIHMLADVRGNFVGQFGQGPAIARLQLSVSGH
jgi:hypothetical protein